MDGNEKMPTPASVHDSQSFCGRGGRIPLSHYPKYFFGICSLFRGNAHYQIMTAMPYKPPSLAATLCLTLSGMFQVRTIAEPYPLPPL